MSEINSHNTQSHSIRWGAWQKDSALRLDFSGNWDVRINQGKRLPKLNDAGVAFAKQAYATRIDHPVDVMILNAYPNDGALFQAETALIPLKTSKRMLLFEEGIVVLLSKCSKGLGYHSLFGNGMPLYQRPLVNRSLKGRALVLFSPHLNRKEFHTAFHETSHVINDWTDVVPFIEKRFRKACRVSILPIAPKQIIE